MDVLYHIRNVLIISMMLCVTFFILYAQEKRATVERKNTMAVLLNWSIAWALFVGRTLLEYAAFSTEFFPLLKLSDLLLLPTSLLFVQGTLLITGRKVTPELMYVTLAAGGFGLLDIAISGSFSIPGEVLQYSIRLMLVYAAFRLAFPKVIISRSRWLAVSGFILLAVSQPFLIGSQPTRESFSHARIIETLSILVISFSLLLVYISRRRRQLDSINENLRLVAENSKDVIFRYEVSPIRRYSFVSTSVIEMFGRNPEEFYADPDIIFSMTNDHGIQLLTELESMEEGSQRPIIIKVFPKSGNPRNVEISITKRMDHSGKLVSYSGFLRDITERIEIENQLRQSQKMEAIGQLAGSISHDFNNMLTAIIGYAELSLIHTKDNPKLAEGINEILNTSERAANLTRKLLAFGRKQELRPQYVPVNQTIQEMQKMLRGLVGESHRLRFLFSSDPMVIFVDPIQLEQILLNLVVNARDSISGQGLITIQTGTSKLDHSNFGNVEEIKQGGYTFISVSDDGCGVSEEIMSRIFEPFFTTKEVGKGTGLGLATVYGIVHQSNGFIDVNSTVGEGSTFTVYFPLSEANPDDPKLKSDFKNLRGNGERILLAEDDSGIRDLVTTTLTQFGYEVDAAENGLEALKLLGNGNNYRLLLLDIMMPKMDGIEMLAKARSLGIQLPVIFITGYPEDIVNEKLGIEKNTPVIHKPFAPTVLLNRIHDVMDYDRDVVQN